MQFTLSCPVHSSYRVQQIAGMFDVPLAEKAVRTFQFESPIADTVGGSQDWQIGCIVGPSGSGKSSIARHIFPQSYRHYAALHSGFCSDKAVIDNFGDISIKDITKMLTVVGFSSPPSWIKPYSVLSNGEQFRCDLARALLEGVRMKEKGESRKYRATPDDSILSPNSLLLSPTVVFDEYTSVVDRNVAQIASAALAKGIKSGKIPVRFVAVTCHYDILDWLEPDWVLDTATGKVSRRLLRRPNIELDIFRCERRLWHRFKTHHYLSGDLAKHCRCYVACIRMKEKGDRSKEDSDSQSPVDSSFLLTPFSSSLTPVAFCALLPQQGFERWYRVSRIVTLPDYQGIGIGSAFLDALAELYVEQSYRFSITASHPSVRSHCQRSERWKAINVMKTGSKRSRGRAVVSFEWK